MSEGNPLDGVVTDYSEMTPINVIKYNNTSNALIFDNPIQTTGGIASSEQAPLSFNSSAVFKSGVSAGVNAVFFSVCPNVITIRSNEVEHTSNKLTRNITNN